MDEDERKKKLLAGKQKLAAFRKKRSRRKKTRNTDDTHSDMSDATFSDTSSVVDLGDIDSLSYDEFLCLTRHWVHAKECLLLD
ncbi:hypothetical protein LSAT2_027471 [Lamellibrachia satsuma]|nr:hypothetical protein LSAT2_027471 [Lamellibrachia satsuma]